MMPNGISNPSKCPVPISGQTVIKNPQTRASLSRRESEFDFFNDDSSDEEEDRGNTPAISRSASILIKLVSEGKEELYSEYKNILSNREKIDHLSDADKIERLIAPLHPSYHQKQGVLKAIACLVELKQAEKGLFGKDNPDKQKLALVKLANLINDLSWCKDKMELFKTLLSLATHRNSLYINPSPDTFRFRFLEKYKNEIYLHLSPDFQMSFAKEFKVEQTEKPPPSSLENR